MGYGGKSRRCLQSPRLPLLCCSLIIRAASSQIAGNNSRIRIQFIQETTAILLCKDTGESPRLILQRLHILNLYDKYISRFGIFDLKGSAEVVDLGQIDVLDVVCIVGVFDLTASPVDALDFDYFAISDFARKRNCLVKLVVCCV